MQHLTNQTAFALSDSSYGGTSGPDFTRYLVICGLLILAIAGTGYAFKRLIVGNMRIQAARRSLQVVDVLPLGGKKRLCVVRCYDRTFVLAQGDREMSLVAELDPVDVPALAPERRTTSSAWQGISSALGLSKKGEPDQPAEHSTELAAALLAARAGVQQAPQTFEERVVPAAVPSRGAPIAQPPPEIQPDELEALLERARERLRNPRVARGAAEGTSPARATTATQAAAANQTPPPTTAPTQAGGFESLA